MRKFYLLIFSVLGIILNSSAQILTPSPTTLDFGSVCVNTVTAAKQISITGSGLTGNVSIGAVTGFTYSKTSGGAYTNTLTFTATEIASTADVYVKFLPTAAGSINGSINISGGGAPSKSVAVTGKGISPSVSINTPKTNICEGESVTFSTTPVNGGVTPTYQWQSDKGAGYADVAGQTGYEYTSTSIVAGEKIRVVMAVDLASAYCATTVNSNEITMQVNPVLIPTISIVATLPVYTTTPQICSGTSIKFSVNTKSNEGTPAYQWKVNDAPVSGETSSTFTTNTLQDGDEVTLEMTSNATCATPASITSNKISVQVSAVPTASTAGSDQAVCATTATLAGNEPATGTGAWTKVSGSGTITSPSSPTSGITGLGVGDNVFRWSISNGSCTVSTDDVTITRSAVPTASTAGSDQAVCATTATLAGNAPATGTGAWTKVSGSGTITSPSSPTSGITGLGVGDNVFRWSISNGSCTVSTDDVTITRSAVPTASTAGSDQAVCATTATLAGNAPATGTGVWTKVSGSGTITSPSSPTSGITGLGVGDNVFRWSISNGSCTVSTDDVTITRSAVPTASTAGSDQAVCATTATLAGNAPATGTGAWTKVSGSGTITSPSSPTSGITGLGVGDNVFRWSISNGSCTVSTDDVTITRSAVPTASTAGSDQAVCATTATLAGNAPATGTGAWTKVSGSGTITSPSSPTSGITGLGVGDNVFRWSISNGSCTVSTDDVTITRSAVPTASTAGSDQAVCATTATLAGNAPATGTGVWTKVSGSGTITSPSSPTSGITGLGVGDNVFRWSISNGSCTVSTDDVTITRNQDATITLSSAAGTDDQTKCINTAITNITYSIGGGGTGATVSGLPTNVTGSYNNGTKTFTISGSPNVSGTFNYTVTVTGPCTNPSLTGTIKIDPGIPETPLTPIPKAGQLNSICPVASGLVYSIPSVVNATSYIWNVPTGWTITSGQGTTSITVDAGTQSTGTKYISVTAKNSCGSVTSPNLQITVGTFANVAAGSDMTVCAGTTQIDLTATFDPNSATRNNDITWVNPPVGSFFPNGNKYNPTFKIPSSLQSGGSVTLTAKASAEGTCPTVTDDMVLTILSVPTANINAISPICSGSTSTITFTATPNTILTYKIGTGSPQTVNVDGFGNASITTSPLISSTTCFLISIAYSSSPSCSNNSINNVSSTITVNPSVVTNAGSDQTVCASSPNVTLAGSVSGGASSGTWSGGAGTFAPNRTTLNAVYTPTATEIAAGSVKLTLTGNDPDGAGPCGTTTDDVLITVNPSVVTNAGSDQTVCASSPNVTLAGSVSGGATTGTWSGGAGAFAPNRTTLNAVYTPTATEIAAGSVKLTLTGNDPDGAGPCGTTTDDVLITVNPSVVTNAGSDQTVCASSPNVTLAGSVSGGATTGTWSGGAGAFAPNRTTLNAVYTPTGTEIAAGSVKLTLTGNDPDGAGPCGTTTDDVLITVNPSVVTNAGSDQTVCASSPNVTLAGSVSGGASSGTWSGGAGTFAPNRTTLNAVYTPTAAEIAAGSVKLTLTGNDPDGAGPCGTTTDDVLITVNPSVVTNAGSDQTVCASSPNVTLAGSVSGGATTGTWSGGAGAFAPNRTTLNAVYTPTATEIAAGSVKLTLTGNDPDGAGPCGTTTDDVLITVNPSVVTNAGSDQTVCASSPNVTLAGSVSGGATSGTWSGGAGTFAPNRTTLNAVYTPTATEIAAGSVKLTLTGNDPDGAGPCGTTTDDVLITVNPSVIISAGSDQTICSNSAATMAGSFNGGATSATWSTSGTGTFSNNNPDALYTPSDADIYNGTVTLTYTTDDPAGPCGATSASMTLTIVKAVAITTQPSNVSICESTAAEFNVVASGSSLSYQWFKGTAPSGAQVVDGGDISGAKTSNLHFSSASLTEAGTYYVVVSGASECSSVTSAQRTLSVDKGITISSQPGAKTVCQGTNDVKFIVMADANGDPLSYQWYKNDNSHPVSGATGATLTINGASPADNGDYYVIISGTSGYMCSSATSTKATLTVTPTVTITTYSPNTATRCQGAGTITYSTTATNLTSLTYSLDANSVSGGNSIDASTGAVTFAAGWSGTTTITASAAGCNGPATTTMTVTTTPTVTIAAYSPATATRCQGAGTVTYSTTATNSTGLTYSLDAASVTGGNSIDATGAVTFAAGWSGTTTITASAAGCNGPATTTMTVITTPTVTITAYSPNTATRCQGAGTVTYSTTATNSTGLTYSLDAASVTGGNSIDATGAVTFAAGWSGTTTVTASAAGCNGPATTTMTVTTTPTVTIAAFSPATATRCQGAGTVTYSTTATNSTGLTYSLDANSVSGGNSIDASTGAVTFAAGWSGTTTITASAAGCNGPATTTMTVITTPTVTITAYSPNTATRCQGAGTVTYSTTATNSTGLTYSLDAASVTGGNSIDATGAVTFAAGWSGTTTITASAAGCNGPATTTMTVTTTPTVTIAAFSPATATRCQGAGTVTYSTTATNSTGLTYSLDAASVTGGNSIDATGAVTFAAGWSGTTTITASAAGCNGPATTTMTVTTSATPAIGPISVTNSSNTSNPTLLCEASNSATITIGSSPATVGTVTWWSSTDGANWQQVSDGGKYSLSQTSLTVTNQSQTTFYKAAVTNESCTNAVYSNFVVLQVIPEFAPTNAKADPTTVCEGGSSVLSADTGYPPEGIGSGQGDFHNANPAGWSKDGQSQGDYLPSKGSSNPTTFSWLETTNTGGSLNNTIGGIDYSSPDPKFAMVAGGKNSILETPVFSLLGQTTASFDFIQSYNFINPATGTIEISTDGGSTYSTILASYSGQFGVSGNKGIMQSTSISLSNYLGMSNLRIRFKYNGTTNSAWAIDGVNTPGASLPISYVWDGNLIPPATVTNNPVTAYPEQIGDNVFTISSTVGGCPGGSVDVHVWVNKNPTLGTISQAPVCSGSSANMNLTGLLPNTTSTIQYTIGTGSPVTVNNITSDGSGNATFPVTLTSADNGQQITIISITGNNSNGVNCPVTTNVPTTLTVNPLPTATVTGGTTICQNDSQSPVVTFTGGTGTGPYTFTYSLNGEANQTIVGDPASITLPSSTSGTFDYVLVNVQDSKGCVNSQSGNTTVTINPQANFTLQPSDLIECPEGGAVGFTVTTQPGSTGFNYTWQVDDGSGWQPVSSSYYKNDYTVSNTTNADNSITSTLTVDNLMAGDTKDGYSFGVQVTNSLGGCEVNSGSGKLTIKSIWHGYKDQDWNNALNWSDNEVPTQYTCDSVIILNVTNWPILSSGINGWVNHLKMRPGAKLRVTGNTMHIAGSITDDDMAIDATAGTIDLNGNMELYEPTQPRAMQTIAGRMFNTPYNNSSGRLENLKISSPNNASVAPISAANDTLNITGTLSFGNVDGVTLKTGDNITLVSNANGTARVGDLTNSDSTHNTGNNFDGLVTVERYVNVGPGATQHGQSWEFLAVPTKGQTIHDSWMENGQYHPWYGTQITGPGGGGFDRSSLLPSMKYYVPGSSPFNLTSPDWKGISSVNDPIYDSSGYMLYVWGDRSISTGLPKASITNTRMRTKGDLLTYQVTTPAAADMFTSIGNPYASAIDMTKVQKTGKVDEFFTVWQSFTFGNYGYGSWITYELDPTDDNYHNVDDLSIINNNIQSGQAFVVQTTGGTGNLIFNESSKAAGSSYSIFRGMSRPVMQLHTTLSRMAADGSKKPVDANLVQYNEDYSNKIDGRDARKMFNNAENLYIRSGGKDLIVERRQPIEKADTIFYRFTNQSSNAYQFELVAKDLDKNGAQGYLIDKYNKSRTTLNMNGVTTYEFSVGTDSASKDAGRFYIVFKAAVTLPFAITSVKAELDNGNVDVNWQVTNEKNMKQYEVERSTDGVNFMSKTSVVASNSGSGNYRWTDEKPLRGAYYYRIRCVASDGKIQYSNMVKVLIGDGKPSISIYPNPITNGVINLHLNNLPAGRYDLRLINHLGQVITRKQIERMSGSSTESIQWNYYLAHGIYTLEITKPDGEVKEIKVIY